MNSQRRDILIMTALATLAIGIRYYGLDWGLPEVFEEATPLRKAWDMWGWDRDGGVDLNPHFFNYPSLSIYLHFLWQGLLFMGLGISGAIASTLDFNTMYLVAPTPIFLSGRWLSLLFGTGTVLVVYRMGRLLSGRVCALLAAILLAVNSYHVDQSQQITVDIPLTFLTMTCLLFCLRILENPRKTNYLLAGLVLGLATSTKYTGALLALPLLATHLLAWNQARRTAVAPPRWRWVVFAAILGAATFCLTSPFVLLDFPSFQAHFSTEREHMQLGHFGLDDTPAWQFYLQRLGGALAGWPVLLAALAAVALSVRNQLSTPTLVLVVYLLVFLLPMGTWSMKADRYLLPVLPVFLLLAGLGVQLSLKRLKPDAGHRILPVALAVAALGILAIAPVRAYPELWNRARKDTRAMARQWIEENLPEGSFIISEAYGPNLLHPAGLMHLPTEVTSQLFSDENSYQVYALLNLPMFQTRPERSGAYYHLDLYPDADYMITSSSISSRYRKDSVVFKTQNSFYGELAASWKIVKEFDPRHGTGPHLTLYENPLRREPFVSREELEGPSRIEPPSLNLHREEGFYYFSMGVNYMVFGHPEHALASYLMGLDFRPQRPEIHTNLVLGTTQALLEIRGMDEALQFLDTQLQGNLPPSVHQAVLMLRQDLMNSQSSN